MKTLRGWAGRALVLSMASISMGGACLAIGCASELAEPDSFKAALGGNGGGGAPNTTGGSGGHTDYTGGTVSVAGAPAGGVVGGGSPPLAPCAKTIFANQCANVCHSTAFKDSFGGLDLSGDNVADRLRNVMAKNGVATNAAACGTKLIDPDDPAASVLLKRVAGKSDCGDPMPAPLGLSGADLQCIRDWVMTF